VLQPGRDAATIEGLGLEHSRADILDPADLPAAFSGCDAVVHTAALTNVWPSRSEALTRVNVEGTSNVVDACLQLSVDRMVYVATANSFGFGSKDDPGDESRPFSAGRYRLGYIDTKYRALRLVLDAVENRGLPAVCVAPTFMIGPYDSKPGSGALILAVCRGQVPGCAPGGRNYIYVRDAVVGIVNALRSGAVGETYLLGNQNLSYRELFGKVAAVVGGKAPSVVYPAALVKLIGFFGSLAGKLSGRTPGLSYAMARIACDGHYYRADKAVRELALPQTPVEEAIRAAYEWFLDNGYLEESGG
jgi:dihydroflavonol-4-reductase